VKKRWIPAKIALTNNGGRKKRKPNFEVVVPRDSMEFVPSSANVEESRRLGGFVVSFLSVPPSGRRGFHKCYRGPGSYSVHTACLGREESMLLGIGLFPRTPVRVEKVGPGTFFVPFSVVERLGGIR
jgi:hypothetical protein